MYLSSCAAWKYLVRHHTAAVAETPLGHQLRPAERPLAVGHTGQLDLVTSRDHEASHLPLLNLPVAFHGLDVVLAFGLEGFGLFRCSVVAFARCDGRGDDANSDAVAAKKLVYQSVIVVIISAFEHRKLLLDFKPIRI